MPFTDDAFDRVFSTGVIHFWTEPASSLAEVHRVLRPGGAMLMSCLAHRGRPDFARSEYGFHIRDASAWDALCRDAGFITVNVETLESKQITPDGAPTTRFTIRVMAQA